MVFQQSCRQFGKEHRMFCRTAALLVVLSFADHALGADGVAPVSRSPEQDQGTVHSVEAKVDYPTNAGVDVQAEKQPGAFTIPKGSKAKKLKYSFFDPKSGRTLTTLHGSNVFSMTEHRYMTELDANPDFELPSGDYKFVIGGQPGASGVLTYTRVTATDKKPPTLPPKDKVVHTVDAGVEYPTNSGIGIEAEKRPGEFAIPKGSKAKDFKYHFHDPKSGQTLTKLRGNNVYSVTLHRYMKEFDTNPNFELPAGDYKFVVGGKPGAKGTLSYTAVPTSDETTLVEPPTDRHSGYDWLYMGVWLPERYFPAGYRHYSDSKMPSGDPAIGNGTQSLWFGIPLKSRGGRPSSSAGEHPYTIFIDGIAVYKSAALAKKMFETMKSGPFTKTPIALGDDAYIDEDCKDSGSLFKVYRDKAGEILQRDLNVRNIRVGSIVFGLRVNGDRVQDYHPNVPNSRRFIAHETPSEDEILEIAKLFVSRIRAYGNDKGWINP
jgi:hypothetical protein